MTAVGQVVGTVRTGAVVSRSVSVLAKVCERVSRQPLGDDERDEKSTVNSVLKALAILECFSPESPERSVAELASITGMNKATCHRLVGTMARAGWLVRSRSAHYRPTFKVFRVGSTAIGRIDVRESARDILRRLAYRFGDTGYLMVPDGSRAVCLDKVEGEHPVQINFVDIGSSLPLHVGAAPQALLAFRDDLFDLVKTENLRAFTHRTTTAVTKLSKDLAEVRERGYAVSVEDVVEGIAAVGAPAFDADGVAVAAVSMGGLALRFGEPRRAEIVDAVVQAAAELSSRLGNHPGSPERTVR